MGTGNILFRNEIFKYMDATPINSVRGEKELPELVQCAINDGQQVLYFPLASAYLNINTPEDFQELKSR